MSPGRWRSLAACLLALAGSGCALPLIPQGATSRWGPVVVRTDTSDRAFAGRIARQARAQLATLRRTFGAEAPSAPCEVHVFTSRATFEQAYARLREHRGHASGFHVGLSDGSCIAAVDWPTDAEGGVSLTHELVHHWVEQRLPDLPRFLNEGLAYELTHTLLIAADSDLGCGVHWALEVGEDELRAAWRSREGQGLGAAHYALAAALIRFGIEAEGWRDLEALESWRPDLERFLSWLSTPAARAPHQRFPALGRGGSQFLEAVIGADGAPRVLGRSVDEWVSLVESGHSADIDRGLSALGALGSRARTAAPTLLRLLRTPHQGSSPRPDFTEVSRHRSAAHALARVAPDLAVAELSRLASQDPHCAGAAVRAVARIDPPTEAQVEALLSFAADGQLAGDDRAAALRGLRSSSPAAEATVAALERALEDDEPVVRSAAAFTLGVFPPHERLRASLDALAAGDPDDHVRRRAARTLAAWRSDAAWR